MPVITALIGGLISMFNNIAIISKGGTGKNGSSIAVSIYRRC